MVFPQESISKILVAFFSLVTIKVSNVAVDKINWIHYDGNVKENDYTSIKKVLRSFYRVVAAFGKEFDYPKCSLNEAIVIGIIDRHPGIHAKDIASLIALDKGYLSRLLHSLEKRAIISRNPPAKPSSEKEIFLSEKGKKISKETTAILDESITRNLALLNPEERGIFLNKIDSLGHVLDRMTSAEGIAKGEESHE